MIQLESCETQFGTITVFRHMTSGATIYDQDGSSQSEVDRAGISLAPYIHALYGLLDQAGCRAVLMIGCGGGTLASLLARTGREVAIVDPNWDSFRLARKYFQLPADVVCHHADGKAYLQATTEQFDAIVLDAYHGPHIPAHLRTQTFMELVSRRLKRGGIVLTNEHVADDSDPEIDRIAEAASNVWRDVRILDAPGYFNRNAIVAAGNIAYLRPPELRIVPAERADDIAFELSTMGFRAPKLG
ncbi:MAG TPA: fused MFS/spermidine synthase [Rhizomicrobium sp.]|nr:fused MFS/spermidine synthase [Rhizomicrobium sp.]